MNKELLRCPFCGEKDSVLSGVGCVDDRLPDPDFEMQKKMLALAVKSDDPYRFFRGNKTSSDIIAMSREPFVEFDPTIHEYQLSFDIDPLDQVDDCGSSCEAF